MPMPLQVGLPLLIRGGAPASGISLAGGFTLLIRGKPGNLGYQEVLEKWYVEVGRGLFSEK